MRLKTRFVIYLIFIAIPGIILMSGCSGPNENDQQSLPEISNKKVALEIQGLVRNAFGEMTTQSNMNEAEKLLKTAVQKAESTYDKTLIINTYNYYLELLDNTAFNKERLIIAKKAEEISVHISDPHLVWRTFSNCCNTFQTGYQYDKALDFGYRCHTISEELNEDSLKILSSLMIGACLEKRNHFIEAFRNYLQALNIADKGQNDRFRVRCYSALAQFYNLRHDFNKAIEYKLKQADLLRLQPQIDSPALMNLAFELEDINNYSRHEVNLQNIKTILNYARQSGNAGLLNKTFALYRSYLINNEKFEDLKTFYTLTCPEELLRLRTLEPATFCRVKAYICEISGNTDSAEFFFLKAKELTDPGQNKIYRTNFYIRLGQFYNRHNKTNEASVILREAYTLARTTTNLDFSILAATELQKTLSTLGDYKEAYSFAIQKQILSDSLMNSTKKDELLLLEIDNAAKMRDEALAREKEQEVQRHNLQYSAIIVALVVVFILVIVLGSFRVPDWTIHFAGFFSLIFLFEFIILLIDEKIHALTHGEPWKVLSIKIVLLSILLPIHQYAEKRVINYLLSHKLLQFSSFSLRKFLKEIFLPHQAQG